MIRPWTEPLSEIRAALRGAGIAARISRVDIEPALNAALSRGDFDVVVYDPRTKELSKDTVIARLREHGRVAPVVDLTSDDKLPDAIWTAVKARLN